MKKSIATILLKSATILPIQWLSWRKIILLPMWSGLIMPKCNWNVYSSFKVVFTVIVNLLWKVQCPCQMTWVITSKPILNLFKQITIHALLPEYNLLHWIQAYRWRATTSTHLNRSCRHYNWIVFLTLKIHVLLFFRYHTMICRAISNPPSEKGTDLLLEPKTCFSWNFGQICFQNLRISYDSCLFFPTLPQTTGTKTCSYPKSCTFNGSFRSSDMYHTASLRFDKLFIVFTNAANAQFRREVF